MNKRVLRHIDVCINRIQEASRLLDEICRFHFNLPVIQKELKEFRHQLKNLFNINYNHLINARDSLNDMGFSYTLNSEATRDSISAIIRSSCKRIIESLRILEEYAKLPEFKNLVNLNIETLRQKFYALEKELILKSCKWIFKESVYPINPESNFENFLTEISFCSSFFQLRLKNKSKLEIISIIQDIKKNYPELKIIINDHVDIAIAEDLAGVHLGQDDLPLKSARKILGDQKIIGISTHSLKQAKEAEEAGADYIGFGPVFPTNTKQTGYSAKGLELLREICSKISIPVVAIGGINKTNFASVLATGATSCAMISDLASNTRNNYNLFLKMSKKQ